MLGSPLDIVLCRYQYDALNQTIGWAPRGAPNLQRFYRKDRLATEIQAAAKWSFFEYDHHVLAQRRQTVSTVDTTLLAIDQQRSVLNALDATPLNRFAYSPYGFRPQGNGLLSLLGFNGERPDPVTGHYHLGNGYRQFNTVLMRFNSPDSWSPFGRGGLNAYAYCAGDPVNRADPTGHVLGTLKKYIGLKTGKPVNPVLKTLFREYIHTSGGTSNIYRLAESEGQSPEHYVLHKTIESTISSSNSSNAGFNFSFQDANSIASAKENIARLRFANVKYDEIFLALSELHNVLPAEHFDFIKKAHSSMWDFYHVADNRTADKINELRLNIRNGPSTVYSYIPYPPYPSAPDLSTSNENIRGS